jgi:hypothetical protein
MVWGDRFIITPSEFLSEKWTFYPALVIYRKTRLLVLFSVVSFRENKIKSEIGTKKRVPGPGPVEKNLSAGTSYPEKSFTVL